MCVKGVLESDRVVLALRRDCTPSYTRHSIDAKTERETEGEKQAEGKLHPRERGWGTRLEIILGWEREEASHRSFGVEYIAP